VEWNPIKQSQSGQSVTGVRNKVSLPNTMISNFPVCSNRSRMARIGLDLALLSIAHTPTLIFFLSTEPSADILRNEAEGPNNETQKTSILYLILPQSIKIIIWFILLPFSDKSPSHYGATWLIF
jgi:hypothetical protein